MLTNERIRKIFRESEALMNGHFLLTSGRHSDRYMQCARIFQYPWLAEELFRDLADKMSVPKVDVVIGPETLYQAYYSAAGRGKRFLPPPAAL